MIDTAIVFVSGLAADPAVRIAGLGLLERALYAAARAGIRRCFVVDAPIPARGDSRNPAEIISLPGDAAAAEAALRAVGLSSEQPLLCLHAAVVCHPPLLAALAAAPPGGGVPALACAGDGGLPLPLAVAPPASLGQLWSPLRDADRDGLQRLCDRGAAVRRPIGDQYAAHLERPSAAAAVERGLLRGLENPRDGRLDTLLNRKLSRPLSRVFLRFPVHPNHITVLAFAVAVVGAVGFAQGTYWASLAGALLLQLAAVLDCSDGEVARVKFLESRLGDALDITLDSVANALIFVGIARGAWVTGALAHAHALGLAAALGILGAFAVVTYVEKRLPEPSPIPAHRRAQALVGAMTTRDFSAIVFAAAALGILPWFLWGAAIGAHVFWALLLALVLRGRPARQHRD